MNWELIHRIRRARRDKTPQLLEQTRRMAACLTVGNRLQELSAAVSAVAGHRGDWDDVAAALCGVIADAGVALDGLTDDAAFDLDRYIQRMATALPVGPAVLTLQAAAALSPALLQPPRRTAA